MAKIHLPKWKQPQRAFLVNVLRDYSNFHKLEDVLVISSEMPLPEDIGLKVGEEILRTKEMTVRIVIK
jgi:hypothetical protein